MHAHIARLAVVFCFLPGLAFAWFNDDWASRKQFSIDASITGADIKEPLADFPMLVRLHTGNFGFFADLSDNGEDLRFMADDKTPVKFHIEKFDKTGAAKQLPQAIQDAAKTNYTGYTLTSGEQITVLPTGVIYYRIQLRKGAQKLVVYVDANGQEITKDNLPKTVTEA